MLLQLLAPRATYTISFFIPFPLFEFNSNFDYKMRQLANKPVGIITWQGCMFIAKYPVDDEEVHFMILKFCQQKVETIFRGD
jgi:hypothetical protein